MKIQTPEIRPFDLATDTKILSGIWFDASLVSHSFIGEAQLTEQRQLIEEKYLPNSETWVACRGKEQLGFISLLQDFIGALFIAPDSQGQGIGGALVNHARTRTGALSLEVYLDNKQAVSFYTGLGFQEVFRRDHDDLGQPFANALMRLE